MFGHFFSAHSIDDVFARHNKLGGARQTRNYSRITASRFRCGIFMGGVIEPDGSVDVRLIYDHRVLDGTTVARALAELEETLNRELVNELRARVAA